MCIPGFSVSRGRFGVAQFSEQTYDSTVAYYTVMQETTNSGITCFSFLRVFYSLSYTFGVRGASGVDTAMAYEESPKSVEKGAVLDRGKGKG
eukprot:3462261-Amphidinium_carterae.3